MRTVTILLMMNIAQMGLTQTRFSVSSEAEFETALFDATNGDSIVWVSGAYDDVFMDIGKAGLVVTAEKPGSVVFSGASRVEIDADDVVLSGFQFIGGNIGTDHVIRNWGSDVLITQINIQDYTSYKYLIVDEDSRRTTISYCNFENRLNPDDQNILSILVDNEPGYHKIQYCSFRNFEGEGNDMGIEPIRIGVSTQAHLDSRTIVEYCYFENCDGDGELISNKAAQNVMRYNTFVNNTKAELVLRHGDNAIVYGNFFLNNMGGVRVREGQNHFIYNNYFSGLTRRSLYLQNESSDPLDFIHIYFNTFVDSEEIRLGGSGSFPPGNVVFANNIFADPIDDLFNDPTGTETWLGNLSTGSLGMTRPAGVSDQDPKLIENGSGFLQIGSGSPAIDAAVSGYPDIPTIEGLEFDYELLLDIMKQTRPDLIDEKDAGAAEFTGNLGVQPHATASNTGPDYLNGPGFSITHSTVGEGSVRLSPEKEFFGIGELVTLTAVPKPGFIFSTWSGDISGSENPLTIFMTENLEIIAEFSMVLGTSFDDTIQAFPNPTDGHLRLILPTDVPSHLRLHLYGSDGRVLRRFSKVTDKSKAYIEMDISFLASGTYFLTLQNGKNGKPVNDVGVIKIVKP